MTHLGTLFFLVVVPVLSQAAETRYPVSEIPEALKEDVNVVVREDAMVFKIEARDRAVLTVRFVATIMNNKGGYYARKSVRYSKLEKINYLKGAIYDSKGNLVRKLKGNEIEDRSINDGVALYRDDRIKIADLSASSYPYTVEFEYEVAYKYLYNIPDSWFSGEHVSTQHASYQLIFPPDLAPRYRLVNLDQNPVKEKLKDGSESWSWSFENIKPINIEPYGPDVREVRPGIMAAPKAFEYEGYAGDMSSWEAYGRWFALLNKDRDVLPASTKATVASITAGLQTDEKKAEALYHYLQGKTRYVNISLGIGGLQPFPAEVVDQNGYGDCKALSNYMVALLKEAGVDAYYAVIMAGDDAPPVIEDFPSHQANHVIVAVPGEQDTLWLECTSQTNPFGYMGSFTGNRKALLITADGGKLVSTIRYPDSLNRQIRKADVHLDIDGNAKGSVTTLYAGLQYENGGLSSILNSQFDLQKKWALRYTDIPSFNLDRFSFENRKTKLPEAVVTLDLTLNRMASVSGKRLFLSPNLMNRSDYIPEKNDDRKTDLVLESGYFHVDSVVYHIPETIYPEFLPEPITITSPFGDYQATFVVDEGSLTYVRRMSVRRGRYPADQYNAYIDFRKAVSKADNTKLVFLSKT